VARLDIEKLKAFRYGFFQDILTLMKVLEVEQIRREDILDYIESQKSVPPVRRVGQTLERPCCGDKIDEQVEAFKEKQKKLRMERAR